MSPDCPMLFCIKVYLCEPISIRYMYSILFDTYVQPANLEKNCNSFKEFSKNSAETVAYAGG